MTKRRFPEFLVVTAAAVCGCTGDEPARPTGESDYQRELLTQLITAEPGDVITIPAGTHQISRGLSLNVSGVTIRGEGMDKSILSFRHQVQGAEGLLVSASDFTIEDLAIEDTRGDALKINEGSNIVIRRVRTEWTNGPDEQNGAYGIYPVQTRNVLLEESVAIGASDAGIYVGQSHDVVVRNNRAERNVAGIEIENTVGADVYGNTTVENTGGILVFNMPDLPIEGHSTRVFGNTVADNNTDNFGAEGTPVASVPAGSGIVINSNDRVEIFDNDIADNDTANIIISSYYATGYQAVNTSWRTCTILTRRRSTSTGIDSAVAANRPTDSICRHSGSRCSASAAASPISCGTDTPTPQSSTRKGA